jgi:hypothetical protein
MEYRAETGRRSAAGFARGKACQVSGGDED